MDPFQNIKTNPTNGFSHSELRILIQMVLKYEEIYNPAHAKYTDHCRIFRVWGKIGDEIGVAGGLVRREWRKNWHNFCQIYNKHTVRINRQHPLHDEMQPFVPYICGDWKGGRKTREPDASVKSDTDEDTDSDQARPRSWNTRAFLMEVYKYPEIYDDSHRLHYDLDHIDHVWRKLAKLFGTNEERVSTVWSVKARRFYKIYHRFTIRGGRKYEYHDEMIRFLPFISNHQGVQKLAPIKTKKAKTFVQHPDCLSVSELNKKLLLTLIAMKPELYDKSHPLHSNTAHQINVWNELAAEANSTVQLCKDEWHATCQILDNYLSNPDEESYGLTNEMLFFLPFLQPMPGETNHNDGEADSIRIIQSEYDDLYEL